MSIIYAVYILLLSYAGSFFICQTLLFFEHKSMTHQEQQRLYEISATPIVNYVAAITIILLWPWKIARTLKKIDRTNRQKLILIYLILLGIFFIAVCQIYVKFFK